MVNLYIKKTFQKYNLANVLLRTVCSHKTFIIYFIVILPHEVKVEVRRITVYVEFVVIVVIFRSPSITI